MSELQRLTENEVLAIRRRMGSMQIATRDAFGHIEPVDRGKFSSAVHRQFTSGGGIYKYKSIHDVGATLFFGIAMGHAFENGNKRTALVTLLVLLDKNKYLLVNTSEDDLYNLARELAAHEIEIKKNASRNAETEVQAVSSWLRTRVKPKSQGDTAIPFSELKDILEEQGCRFMAPTNNYIKIKRGRWTVKTGFPRHNFEVPVGEVKKIRRSLHLDATHGIDSTEFYDIDASVDVFVKQYSELMKRLADL